MREQRIDIWTAGGIICITTNGFVKSNGCGVMGAGVAKQARSRIPGIDLRLGQNILRHGNVVSRIAGPDMVPHHDTHVLAFPVKHNWFERADLDLIEQSAYGLKRLLDRQIDLDESVYLPRPGCGNGGLTWPVVRDTLEPILGHHDNLYIVDWP